MTQANRGLVLMLLATLAMWGCSRGAGNVSNPDKIKALEVKIGKLEEDVRDGAAVREQFRTKLSAVEEQRVQIAKQRDQLKEEVATRTSERDAPSDSSSTSARTFAKC